MTTLDISINGRAYHIACDDGQEAHLRALAAQLDARVNELKQAMGIVSDNMLLVLAGLMLADELADAKRAQPSAVAGTPPGADSSARLAAIVQDIAARVEKATAQLEKV